MSCSDRQLATMAACERAGLRVLGPTASGIGMDDGAVVAVSFISPRLDVLEADYRTCPTGRDHTIVVPRP